MTKQTELKFQERILANLNAMLMYSIGKGDKDQQELIEKQVKAQKELIERLRNGKG